MPLLVYNLTGAPVTLAAGSPAMVIPASAAPPARGFAVNVTGELHPNLTVDPARGVAGGLDAAAFTALQVQVTAASVLYEWTDDPEYLTGALVVPGPSPGAHAATHKTAGGTDVLAVASTTATNTAASTGITGYVTRQQQYLGPLLAAGDIDYHVQLAAGAAIDVNSGFAQVVPPRTVQIARGGAGAVTVYTVDGTDPDGAALQEVINSNGATTVQGTRAFATITRFRSDVDPTVTTDLQIGAGFGLGVVAANIDVVGVDGTAEAPTSVHAATGTVVPATAPNSVHVYVVQYRVQGTVSDPQHTHVQSAHAHNVT